MLGDKVGLHTLGKFSPLAGDNVINHGFESDKCTLISALNQVDGLAFSSCVDSYPLILCETFSIGVPAIITHSDAVQEVLARSGGETFSRVGVSQLVQSKKSDIAQVVFDTSLTVFSQYSRAAYSG